MEAESKYTDKYESKFVVYVRHEETGLDWSLNQEPRIWHSTTQHTAAARGARQGIAAGDSCNGGKYSVQLDL